LAYRQFLLRLLQFGLIVKLVEKLARRRATRNVVPQHLCQTFVLAQAFEILDAISAQRIQNQEALYIPGFIQTSVPLFNLQALFHKPRQIQRARSLQKQWNAGICRHAFFQRLWIDLK
jgi:hypothetical protein